MFCRRDFTDPANMRKHKLKDHPNELAAYEEVYVRKRRKPSEVIEERLEMSFEDEELMEEED